MKKVIIPEVEDKCVDLCTIIADEGVHYLLYASLNEEPFGFFSRNDGGMWFFQTGSHEDSFEYSSENLVNLINKILSVYPKMELYTC